MASAIMHIAVAKKVNEYLNMEEKKLYLGTIAPDLSKQVGETKKKSHFQETPDSLPNVNAFLDKYKRYLNNPFEMGYYIHLLTDYYWFKDFLPKQVEDFKISTKNGDTLTLKSKDIFKIIYNDYTNVNISIIDKYNLTLKLFYEEMEYPRTKINEIPINKLKIIVDKMGIIIEESKKGKTYILDLKEIYKFIDDTANTIINILKSEGKI